MRPAGQTHYCAGGALPAHRWAVYRCRSGQDPDPAVNGRRAAAGRRCSRSTASVIDTMVHQHR